jgi:hypothetical protein
MGEYILHMSASTHIHTHCILSLILGHACTHTLTLTHVDVGGDHRSEVAAILLVVSLVGDVDEAVGGCEWCIK